MDVIMFWCTVFGILAVVSGVIHYARLSPEERKKGNEEFTRQMGIASERWNDRWQKWNEEQRQIRAAKRARNATLWGIAGKIIKRL